MTPSANFGAMGDYFTNLYALFDDKAQKIEQEQQQANSKNNKNRQAQEQLSDAK